LITSELKRANLRFAKIIQGYAFPAEIKVLENQQNIPRSSKLLGHPSLIMMILSEEG